MTLHITYFDFEYNYHQYNFLNCLTDNQLRLCKLHTYIYDQINIPLRKHLTETAGSKFYNRFEIN